MTLGLKELVNRTGRDLTLTHGLDHGRGTGYNITTRIDAEFAENNFTTKTLRH